MWFLQNPGRWLFVFDEADNLDENDNNFIRISDYVPVGNQVHVIITSRSSTARDLSTYEGVEIQTFEPTEAINLFLACAKIEGAAKDTTRQAELIADELGYLPLALTIAGSYVSRTPRLAADLAQYLKEHQERQELLRQEPQQLIDMYGRSLMSTWEASYMAAHNQLPDACRVFHILGFFGKDNIHPNLLIWAWPHEGDTDTNWCECLGLQVSGSNDLEKCFSILEKYSMIQRHPSKGTYSMHSLVHAWSLSRLEANEPRRFRLFAASACRILFNFTSRMLKLVANADTDSSRAVALQLVPHLRSGLQALKKHLADPDDENLKRGLHMVQGFFEMLSPSDGGLAVLEILLQKPEAIQPDTTGLAAAYGTDIAHLENVDEGIRLLLEAAETGKHLGDEHPIVVFLKDTLEGFAIHRTFKIYFEKDLRSMASMLQDQVSSLQSQRNMLIERRQPYDESVQNMQGALQNIRENHRHSLLPLYEQGLEAILQVRSSLEPQIALITSTIEKLQETLADEDLGLDQGNRTFTRERRDNLLRASMRCRLMTEKVAVDLDRLNDLRNLESKKLREMNDLIGKMRDETRKESSLWRTLKATVGTLFD